MQTRRPRLQLHEGGAELEAGVGRMRAGEAALHAFAAVRARCGEFYCFGPRECSPVRPTVPYSVRLGTVLYVTELFCAGRTSTR